MAYDGELKARMSFDRYSVLLRMQMRTRQYPFGVASPVIPRYEDSSGIDRETFKVPPARLHTRDHTVRFHVPEVHHGSTNDRETLEEFKDFIRDKYPEGAPECDGILLLSGQQLLEVVHTAAQDAGLRGFYTVQSDDFPWFMRPYEGVDAEAGERHDQQRELDAYMKAVKKLDLSPAGHRATQLLWDHLDRDQQRSYSRYRYFEVTVFPKRLSESPGRRYRLHGGFTNGNINLMGYLYGGVRNVATYCLHPEEPHPTGDVLLAQKLLIETDEQEFLEMANVS